MKILKAFLFILPVISINILNAQQIEGKFSQPYFEGFENTTFPPSGWQNINVSGNVTWMIGYFAHSGTQAAVCAWQSVGIGEDWLITPRWNILSGDSLVFWLRPFFVGHPPDSLAVRVSTTDSIMSSFTTRILLLAEGNGYPSSTIYQRYSVSLNQFANQGIFIAFKHMDQNGDGIFIDDVSIERIGPVGINKNEIPAKFVLYQNYPNPFNPVTKIDFSIPKNGLVTIKIYDILGKEVEVITSKVFSAGKYSIDYDGSKLSSGVYFYKLTCHGQGDFSDMKKMILIK